MDKDVADFAPTNQWQNLVSEASKVCQISLSEDLESYLVFLLMRFTNSPQMAQNIMALEFLQSLNKLGSQKSQALRDVGDQCLLYSGLFPGRAKRRLVRVSYYVNIGKSAYLSLSNQGRYTDNNLFADLSAKFVQLMDILQSMREVDNSSGALDVMQAAEVWHDTGSDHALNILKKFTINTVTPISGPELPYRKH